MPENGKLTRRQVNHMAGAAVAAGPFIQKMRAAGDQVAFGVVGTGSRGQYLLERLNHLGSGRCVALCDNYEPHLSKAAQLTVGGPGRHTDYRHLLEQKDVAAVLIATPLHTHFPIARDALLAGKHVFCEPPLVFRPQEVHALRELAAARSAQTLQVGLERRYSQFYQTARQMASKGMLGEVTDIQAQWHRNPGWTMDPNQPRERNWRLFREYSGGLTAEFASHQIDVASWVFSDSPEFVVGVGALDWRRDGRDVYDNIALILRYPGGRKMTYSANSTSRHLPLFGGSRSGAGEIIMGTEGSIEITVGNADEPAFGLWFYEPPPAKEAKTEEQKEMMKIAGATVASAGRSARGLPIILAPDQFSGDESFLERELKYSRRWLYSKGIMVPREDRNPVDAQLDGFFTSCRTGKTPKADVDAGLDNASTVILANLAMEEGRRVPFSEMEKLGREKPTNLRR